MTDATVIDMQDPNNRRFVTIVQLIARLKIESRSMRPRGPAATTLAKQHFPELKGMGRARMLAKLEDMRDEMKQSEADTS